jgi:CheY-like chemotaxis protein
MPHILFVEDHSVIAQAVTETLEAQGWRVTHCGDGAVALLRMAGKTAYDLLLCDNQLPSVTGIELVHAPASQADTDHYDLRQ